MEPNATEKKAAGSRGVERVLLGLILLMQVAILVGVLHLPGRAAQRVPAAGPDHRLSRNESLHVRGGAGHPTAPAGSPSAGDSSAFFESRADNGSMAGPFPGRLPPSWPGRSLHPAAVQRDMDAMWEQAMSEFEQMESFMRHLDDGWAAAAPLPAMDMREEPDRYVVLFSLPGLDGSNITVNLEGRLLTVSSKTTDQARARFSTYSFQRRVLLPGPVEAGEQAQAVMSNGVLRVSVPKAA